MASDPDLFQNLLQVFDFERFLFHYSRMFQTEILALTSDRFYIWIVYWWHNLIQQWCASSSAYMDVQWQIFDEICLSYFELTFLILWVWAPKFTLCGTTKLWDVFVCEHKNRDDEVTRVVQVCVKWVNELSECVRWVCVFKFQQMWQMSLIGLLQLVAIKLNAAYFGLF